MANYTIIIRSVFTIHFSRKLFYDNQRAWFRTNSYASTSQAIQDPFTFYYVQDNDWSTTHNYDYWNKSFTSATTVNNTATTKTIFDPSISSFALPKTAAFTGFTYSNKGKTELNISGNFIKGWNFYTDGWKSGGTTFFGVFGFRDVFTTRPTGTGVAAYILESGLYWTSGASNTYYARCLYFGPTTGSVQHQEYRSFGFTVRPTLE